MTTQSAAPALDEYADTARYQRPWYWYDWANSAFVTTTATVLFGPYLTAIATEAACPGLADGVKCTTDLEVLGLPIDPGSLHPYTVALSTFVGALLLIFVGAIADRVKRPARLMALFAGIGSVAASLMFFVEGTNWQLGVILLMVASIALGASLVVYDAILVRIAHPDDRDKVSSRGWALGYLGGGLLLAVNFLMLSNEETFGGTGQTVRISMLMAGLWWGLFTLIPVLGMWQMRGVEKPVVAAKAGVVGGTFRQLSDTFKHLLGLRQTLLFLVAYMFFNDGIQTVIGQSSLYGTAELGFSETTMLTLFLMVQFVAFGGALIFGQVARRLGAWRTVLGGIGMWVLVIVAAFFVPEKALAALFALGVGIGLVMGGTQALSRSMYSQLVPRDREAEFFSLYQALERGTSWFGAVIFGVVHQLTDSYRPAILALIVFFVLGGVLLAKVDMRKGIREAGNEVPAVV
ncbi:MFS transporter [Knoellia sp. LjRoot47]|uniref:MFS transporter n=1 Tax=Knoellia sp. LjRoot47 TaxID=3342330 RepID=UPI003ED06A34